MTDFAESVPDRRGATDGSLVSWTVPPEDRSASTIDLWTPRGIGWASVLLGFPGATLLAALNWRRVGRARKAIVHLVAAVIGTWALAFVDARAVGLAVGIAVAYYLYRVQSSDQSTFKDAGRVTERNGLAGALIAIAGTLVIIGSAVPVAGAVAAATVPHRGEVPFGVGKGTDACSPAGQATVFGPTDPILIGATMRETVQPGSHVVEVIDAPTGTVGPFPVNVQPPFDCFGTSESIGPLDPGTYVIHFRYDSQPGTGDLAAGTFTVRSSPGG